MINATVFLHVRVLEGVLVCNGLGIQIKLKQKGRVTIRRNIP